MIENVGNLVCPAIYDLGEAAAVVALSVTEGEDKPLKYPMMFHGADLVLLTKIDLLPHLPGFRMDGARGRARPHDAAPAGHPGLGDDRRGAAGVDRLARGADAGAMPKRIAPRRGITSTPLTRTRIEARSGSPGGLPPARIARPVC